MTTKSRIAATVALVVALEQYADIASAQNAEERTGELKTWRTQCADPDPMLRLAYIEQAIASGDASVERICIRESLESDDADVRNLGLRAAIASMNEIFFETESPPELVEAIKQAGSDEKKLKQIEGYHITTIYRVVRNGLIFKIDSASLSSKTSVWYPLAALSERSDNFKGDAQVIGTQLSWQGRIKFGPRAWTCVLSANLGEGAKLAGDLKCDQHWPIPISASLM